MDVLFDLLKMPKDQMIQWPPFMHIMLKRVIEAGLVSVHAAQGGVFLMGMRANPDYVKLTDAGRHFLDEIGAHEL